jgi:hypothetical protein
MAYMSARELLSGLPVKMAEGGPVTYGKGATAADLLAAEQRVLGEIAADPSGWDVETAYNAILESGVTIDDALAAGVKQTTIDAIFRSGAPLPETFSTPSTVTSGFAAAPYAGQDLQPFYTQAQDYVTRLMDDGVIDEAERREAQTLATRGGFTFQDFAAAGVDPSILFTQPAAAAAVTPAAVTPAWQQTLSPRPKKSTSPQLSISRCPITLACMQPAKSRLTENSGTALHGPRSSILMATSLTLITRLLLVCARPPDRDTTGHRPR